MDYALMLENLMAHTKDSIYFKDLQSRFIMLNLSCAKKHGCESPDPMLGKTDFDTFSKEHAEQAFADEQTIIKTGIPVKGLEEKETWPDGRITWVSTTKMPLRDDNGTIIGTFGISRDITKSKEAKLRAAKYAEQIRRIKEEMEDDIDMAAEMQKSFFPVRYPVFPEGEDPNNSCVRFLHQFDLCREISGDYCSIKQLSATEVGIFICDVSGVGIRAAMGTALIRGIMQEIVPMSDSPGTYLERLNELIYPLIHKEEIAMQVSACYLVLDVTDGRVRMASASHPIPLHFRNGREAGWLFENLAFQGPSLAAGPVAVYPEISVKLEPSDMLVLYTDGIFSVENALRNPYGKKRLLGSACSLVGEPLQDVFSGLVDDALAFSEGGTFTDDVCLIGFELKGLLPEA
jgi:PAS domain S-box-containing protein